MNSTELNVVRLRIPAIDPTKKHPGSKYPSTGDLDSIEQGKNLEKNGLADPLEMHQEQRSRQDRNAPNRYLDTENLNILSTEGQPAPDIEGSYIKHNPKSLKSTLDRILTQAETDWTKRSSVPNASQSSGGLEDGQHTDKLVRKIQIYDLFTVFMIIIGNGLGFFEVGRHADLVQLRVHWTT